MTMTFIPGQPIYVVPCGMGRYGNTHVSTGINPLTKKHFDPVVTIGFPALFEQTTFVNTDIGPILIDRVRPR